MAGELIRQWGCYDLTSNSSTAPHPHLSISQVPGSWLWGRAFPAAGGVCYGAPFRVPDNATLATGIKVDLLVVDDGKATTDLGTAVVFGVRLKNVVGGTDGFSTTDGGPEVVAALTLPGTSGLAKILTVSIPTASLDGIAAGSTGLIQIRRAAENSGDTCRGRVLLAGVAAYAY